MKKTIFTQLTVDTHLTKGAARLCGACEIEIGDEALGYTVHDVIELEDVKNSFNSEDLKKVEEDKDVIATHYYYRTNRRDAWHSPEIV